MRSALLSYLTVIATCFVAAKAVPGLPDKIYGVNLGSWLVAEPWMFPEEWVSLGGERCDDCSTCIANEYNFAKAYGNDAEKRLKPHWDSWFNQTDVDQMVAAGINTVRIPLGYWIVEPLVDRKTEFYTKGGIHALVRGLEQLKKAGIAVILDHHALPGVANPNQMFAGRCTSDVQFYTPKNYRRALVWTAVMTTLSHLHPSFSTVGAIEAMNEPIMNSDLTPGYGGFQKDFVQTIRAVEAALFIRNSNSKIAINAPAAANLTQAFDFAATSLRGSFNSEVLAAVLESIPAFAYVAAQLNFKVNLLDPKVIAALRKKEVLTTNFMDVSWQYGPNRANPADAADGPQIYDNHLYYSFGGVSDPNAEAYLTHNCNLDRIEKDAELGNSPLYFGEWSLATNFPADDDFLKKWADSQKLQYSKGAGWIFWSWKTEVSEAIGNTPRQWSYKEALRRGYFTQDPTQLNDPHVCDQYIVTPTTASA